MTESSEWSELSSIANDLEKYLISLPVLAYLPLEVRVYIISSGFQLRVAFPSIGQEQYFVLLETLPQEFQGVCVAYVRVLYQMQRREYE